MLLWGCHWLLAKQSPAESNYSEQGVIQYLTQTPNVMDSVLSNQRTAHQDWSQRQQDKRLSQYFDSASASKVTGDVPVSAVPPVFLEALLRLLSLIIVVVIVQKALSNIEALKKQSKDEFTLVYRPVGMLGGQSRFWQRS